MALYKVSYLKKTPTRVAVTFFFNKRIPFVSQFF